MNERCARMRERLSAYLDGELDAAATAEVDAHLDTCGECAAVLAGYSAADDALAEALPARSGVEWEALASRVDAAIEREVQDVARAGAAVAGAAAAEPERPAGSWRRRRRLALGSAATLVVALLIAVLQPWWETEQPDVGRSGRPPADTLDEPGPVLRPDADQAGRPPETSRPGKPEGTLGVTLSKENAPRVPGAVVRGESVAPPNADSAAEAEETASPEVTERLRALGYVGSGALPPADGTPAAGTEKNEGKDEAEKDATAQPKAKADSRSRQVADGSLYRSPEGTAPIVPDATGWRVGRSESDREGELERMTRLALGTDDPQPSLLLAREWDAFVAAYPTRSDVLPDRAAAWVRAARLGAEGACAEAPSRIDDWERAAAGDDGRAEARALRDELAASCP